MRVILLLLALSLSACGFHLRGHSLQESGFPFGSLYLKFPAPTPFVADLQNYLERYKIKLETSAPVADLTLEIVSETSDKQVTATSGAGQVLEYQLRYQVSIRAYDKQMQEWVPADVISLQRIMTYDLNQVLAKEQEEGLLYRDMRSDAVQQVLRRLSRAKPRTGPANLPEVVDKAAPASKPESSNKSGTGKY